MLRQSRREPRGAPRGHRLFSGLADTADDDVIHHTGIELVAFDQRSHGLRQKIHRMEFRKRTTRFTAPHG
jgi:hypothetical protein